MSSCSSNITFATFDPTGEYIYAGTKDGWIWVYDAKTRWVTWRQRVSMTLVKQIAFDKTGRYMVVNSSDRAVRVLAVTTPPPPSASDPAEVADPRLVPKYQATIQPLHRFQDTIGRTPWNNVGFSGDGEYVMGGAGTKTSHHIYIWDRSTGVLIKVLEGPKDALDDCDVSRG